MTVTIAATGFDISEELTKYATTKLEHMDRLIPRPDRTTAKVEAVFQHKTTARICELSVHVRGEHLVVRESTQHFYASLDIAVVAIESQLKAIRRNNPAGIRRLVQPNRRKNTKQG